MLTWKTDSLRKLFNPKSIAVIGASDNPQKLGGLTLRALNDYGGKIYPINPRLKQIGHLGCYSDIKDIDEPIDLAVSDDILSESDSGHGPSDQGDGQQNTLYPVWTTEKVNDDHKNGRE